MAASKDKARAILSYATPNPVGPYRLVTPPTPDLGAGKTKTPVMPVMGGPLVNLPTPVKPTKQTTPVAPPMADKLVNVPKQQGRVVDKNIFNNLDALLVSMPDTGLLLENGFGETTRIKEQLKNNDVRAVLNRGATFFESNPKFRDIYDSIYQRERIFNSGDARLTAALDMNRQINVLRSAGVPTNEIPDLLRLRGTEGMLRRGGGWAYGKERSIFVNQEVAYPTDKKLFEIIGKDLNRLDRAGRETYISLLPGWTGTHKELADAARSLSK